MIFAFIFLTYKSLLSQYKLYYCPFLRGQSRQFYKYQDAMGQNTIVYTKAQSAFSIWGIWLQRHAAEQPSPKVQGTQEPSGLSRPSKQLDMSLSSQKRMPLVMTFWVLYVASRVYSYSFKYNLWSNQSWTGDEWAKNINTYWVLPNSF